MISAGRMVPGDLSVCFTCGGFLQMKFDRRMWKLTDADFVGLPDDMRHRLLLIRQQAKAVRRKN